MKTGFPWKFPKEPKEPTKPSWDSFYMRLAEFQKLHGHCDMKLVLPLDEQLHRWAQEQRNARQARTITPDQVARLDKVGFIWNTHDLLWERMWNVLNDYKSAHGDTNVPKPYWQENPQLAIWVDSQRKQRADGRLKKDRVERLKSLGFQW